MRMVAMLLVVVILSGCGKNTSEIERAMALRSKLLKADSCSFAVKITADYGDKLNVFSVECQGNNEGDVSFSVIQPETISGISGTITEEHGALTFDDKVLYFDKMAEDQISPVTAPWIFFRTLRSGNITSTCMEDEYLRISMDDSYEENELHLDIWLDQQDSPVRAEIVYDGQRILSLEVEKFLIV